MRSYLRGVHEYYQFAGALSLPAFLRLLRDTQLIPSILGEAEASAVFLCCESPQHQGLSFEQLEEALLRVTVCVRFGGELEGVERLLHLLERVCGSERG